MFALNNCWLYLLYQWLHGNPSLGWDRYPSRKVILLVLLITTWCIYVIALSIKTITYCSSVSDYYLLHSTVHNLWTCVIIITVELTASPVKQSIFFPIINDPRNQVFPNIFPSTRGFINLLEPTLRRRRGPPPPSVVALQLYLPTGARKFVRKIRISSVPGTGRNGNGTPVKILIGIVRREC